MKVLVVDASVSVRKALERILSTRKLEVAVFCSRRKLDRRQSFDKYPTQQDRKASFAPCWTTESWCGSRG